MSTYGPMDCLILSDWNKEQFEGLVSNLLLCSRVSQGHSTHVAGHFLSFIIAFESISVVVEGDLTEFIVGLSQIFYVNPAATIEW